MNQVTEEQKRIDDGFMALGSYIKEKYPRDEQLWKLFQMNNLVVARYLISQEQDAK